MFSILPNVHTHWGYITTKAILLIPAIGIVMQTWENYFINKKLNKIPSNGSLPNFIEKFNCIHKLVVINKLAPLVAFHEKALWVVAFAVGQFFHKYSFAFLGILCVGSFCLKRRMRPIFRENDQRNIKELSSVYPDMNTVKELQTLYSMNELSLETKK